jgi:hypothetical protein
LKEKKKIKFLILFSLSSFISSSELKSVIEWILTVDLKYRPKLPEVIDTLDEKWPDLLYGKDVAQKYYYASDQGKVTRGPTNV